MSTLTDDIQRVLAAHGFDQRVVASEHDRAQAAAYRNIADQTERVRYAREHGVAALEARDALFAGRKATPAVEAAAAPPNPNRAQRRAAARKRRR